MSDMAPNISGMKSVDQPRAMYLAELAADLASRCLGNAEPLSSNCFTVRVSMILCGKCGASMRRSRSVNPRLPGLKAVRRTS